MRGEISCIRKNEENYVTFSKKLFSLIIMVKSQRKKTTRKRKWEKELELRFFDRPIIDD